MQVLGNSLTDRTAALNSYCRYSEKLCKNTPMKSAGNRRTRLLERLSSARRDGSLQKNHSPPLPPHKGVGRGVDLKRRRPLPQQRPWALRLMTAGLVDAQRPAAAAPHLPTEQNLMKLPQETLVLLMRANLNRSNEQALLARSNRASRRAVSVARKSVQRMDLRAYCDTVDDIAMAHISRIYTGLIHLNAKDCVLVSLLE